MEIDLTELGQLEAAAVKAASEPLGMPGFDPASEAEIVDPTTGELVDLADADQLIDCLERIERRDSILYSAKLRVRMAIAALSEGDAKTRRVRGRRRRAKLEMPEANWNQGKLKEAYHSFPQFRDEFLSIASLRVKLREFKKAENESGPPDFSMFRDMVAGAEVPSTAPPRVTIEE